ncbi:hypothetical protein P7C71_g5984, partial [Lecanoromycetidae sp. Uapishka_2]
MPHSSNSLPDDLPFGADNHLYNAWRRSTDGRFAREHDADDERDYGAFVASTQASYGARHGGLASIAPTSIHNVPNKLKRLLRRFPILTWAIIGIFQLGLILTTTGIVLGAATAHARGSGGTKVAVVVLVVWGFVMMVGSAAGGWTVRKGRKEREKLEQRWVADEEIKEKRMTRELAGQQSKLHEIRERKRSLSRGRSFTSVQNQPSPEQRPSFQEMTPAPSQYPEEDEIKPLPLAPMEPMPGDALGILGSGEISPPAFEPQHQSSPIDRESTWTHHLDLSDTDSDSSARARALTNVLIRDNDVLMRNLVRTVSHGGSTPTVLPTSSAVIEANFGVMGGSGSTALGSNTAIHDTSATLLNSSPEHESS